MKTILAAALRNLIISCMALSVGCNTSPKNEKAISDSAKNDAGKIIQPMEFTIADTGQVYFKVNVTKNNEPYIKYEGDYPTGSRFDSSFTVQLCASKHILEQSDMLNIDIYIKEMITGSFPVIVNNEQGKANMLMTPVKGNSFAVSEGSVAITKYNDSFISGKFEGRAIDYDSNKMTISGVFLNLKYK